MCFILNLFHRASARSQLESLLWLTASLSVLQEMLARWSHCVVPPSTTFWYFFSALAIKCLEEFFPGGQAILTPTVEKLPPRLKSLRLIIADVIFQMLSNEVSIAKFGLFNAELRRFQISKNFIFWVFSRTGLYWLYWRLRKFGCAELRIVRLGPNRLKFDIQRPFENLARYLFKFLK